MPDAPHRIARERNDILFTEKSGITTLDAEHMPAAIKRR